MSRSALLESHRARGRRLGLQLKAFREQQGISQSELAHQLTMPLDTLRKIEQGCVASPGFFLVADIAKRLRVDIKKLV